MIMGLIAAAALQATPATQTAVAQPCVPKVLGDACLSGAHQDSLTLADYGVVYISFTPPADLSKEALKAYKGGVKAWLKRYFLPSAKYGQLLAEIRRGPARDSPLLASLPLATLTIDEKTGVKVDSDTTIIGTTPIPITPYFRLAGDEVITVLITTKGTDKTTPTIVAELTTATKLATQLGGHGWLSSAIANDAVTSGLTTIQNKVASNFDMNSGDVSDVKLSFADTQNLQYRFALDPRPTASRSGLFTVQLIRQPSLYTKRLIAGTQLADYSVEGQRDSATTGYFLSRPMAPGKTVLDIVTTKSGAQLGTFQTGGANIAQFEAACGVVKSAIQTPDLGLNPNDITVNEWALFVSGPYAATEAAQTSACMSAEIAKFKQQKLSVPAPPPPPPPPPPPLPPPPSPKLSETALDDYMLVVFKQLAKPAPASSDDDSKVTGLKSVLAPNVELLMASAASEQLGWLGASNNKSAVAKGMETLVFRPGCYFRSDDGRVKFLARRTDPAVAAGKALWVFDIGLTSTAPATADTTTITSLRARSAEAGDADAWKAAMPKKPNCSDLSTAP